jgi:hypothetical protein
MKQFSFSLAYNALLMLIFSITSSLSAQSYRIAGTNQLTAYDNTSVIVKPTHGDEFFGQNANFPGNEPSYTDNGDGTITDNITGLMWQKTMDRDGNGKIDYADKMSFSEAISVAPDIRTGGYSDWRLPSIKEIYSLIMFNGTDPSGYRGNNTDGIIPFINTDFFDFGFGDLSAGERLIDAQFATSTVYVGKVMNGMNAMFGLNLADGRIKGYPIDAVGRQGKRKRFYVLYVRGNPGYGVNQFIDNHDGTISDNATGLMWMQEDNGHSLSWQEALSYAEDFSFAGYNDWRLPDAKELQSIVDYSRSPSTTRSAAIAPIFQSTQIFDETGRINYPFYWSSTTHLNISKEPGKNAVYVCFGEAHGWMASPPESNNYSLLDVHGAGAQRSDPKTGNASDFPYGHGPQGDVVRINNYVRLVRNAKGL